MWSRVKVSQHFQIKEYGQNICVGWSSFDFKTFWSWPPSYNWVYFSKNGHFLLWWVVIFLTYLYFLKKKWWFIRFPESIGKVTKVFSTFTFRLSSFEFHKKVTIRCEFFEKFFTPSVKSFLPLSKTNHNGKLWIFTKLKWKKKKKRSKDVRDLL